MPCRDRSVLALLMRTRAPSRPAGVMCCLLLAARVGTCSGFRLGMPGRTLKRLRSYGVFIYLCLRWREPANGIGSNDRSDILGALIEDSRQLMHTFGRLRLWFHYSPADGSKAVKEFVSNDKKGRKKKEKNETIFLTTFEKSLDTIIIWNLPPMLRSLCASIYTTINYVMPRTIVPGTDFESPFGSTLLSFWNGQTQWKIWNV